jgi:hypothetical protein
MEDTNSLLHQIRNIVREENEPIKKRLDGLEEGQKDQGSAIARLEQGQAQTNTIVGKIKTVVELTEEAVNTMDAGLTEVVKDHRERIKRLEEHTRTTSHKN